MDESAGLCSYYVLSAPFELHHNIVCQIEYYFSDENLPGDVFLFVKTMKSNATAWVKIKTLLTFRKLKTMVGNDQGAVAFAIREYSKLLEINGDGTAVRRRTKLSGTLGNVKERIQRSVRVDNLPTNPSIVSLEKKFNALRVGNGGLLKVRAVRIVNAAKDKGIIKPYATIELETKQMAKEAIKLFKANNDWRSGLRVTIMRPSDEKSPGKSPSKKENEKSDVNVIQFDLDNTNKEQKKADDKFELIEQNIKGKIRSINRASRCVFIVRQSLGQHKRRRSSKSVMFEASEEGLKNKKFAIGRMVIYSLYRNKKTGDEKALDVVVLEPEKTAGDDQDFAASVYKKAPGMLEKKYVTMAKGPPEGSNYVGFGITELRGKPRARCA